MNANISITIKKLFGIRCVLCKMGHIFDFFDFFDFFTSVAHKYFMQSSSHAIFYCIEYENMTFYV